MKISRLKKGITFVIILSFILSPFFGFDVYHTVQAATVKVQKEVMWGPYKKTYKSSDGKIKVREFTNCSAVIIYYNGKLYFKEEDGANRLIHTNSKKATTIFTLNNYDIISSNPKIINIAHDNVQYHIDCLKKGTATLTVKDKKGNIVNKTKVTVKNPDYRIDFKALCKDIQNNMYTAGDTFYITDYIQHNGKRFTKSQRERAIKYGKYTTSGGIELPSRYVYRGGFEGWLAFEPHRYIGKQTGRNNNKKDISEQRRIAFKIYAIYKAEKTEIETKPEDGSWHVFYKGEEAKIPFSIKNQTAERLQNSYSECYKAFIDTDSYYETYIYDSNYKKTIDNYKYKFFRTDVPYIERIITKDTMYRNVLSDFYVMVLPITKEGETYYAETDHWSEKQWNFLYSVNTDIFHRNPDTQINITTNDMIYSSENKDNTFNDFRRKYCEKNSEDYYNNWFNAFSSKENGWNISIVENGISYSNQDNTIWNLADKYGYTDENNKYHSLMNSSLSVFYDMAIEKGWKVTLQKGEEYYSTENIDNSIEDFAEKYDLYVDTTNQIISERKKKLPNDFSFTYEVIYQGKQLFKINCHV